MIDYEDLMELQACAFEMCEQGRSTRYSDTLEEYCQNALTYVDMMEEMGMEADFTEATLPGLIFGIMLFHSENLRDGLDPFESIDLTKRQIAGYLMVTLYNDFVWDGNKVDIELNDFETGMSLVIRDRDGSVDDSSDSESVVFDIEDAIERAFGSLHLEETEEGCSIECDAVEFFRELLVGGGE